MAPDRNGTLSEDAGGAFVVLTLRDLQRALAHLGAEPGPADGMPGPRTRAAIERFERQCRLPVTGAASAEVMAAAQAVCHALGRPPRPFAP